jgi:hypothetical protein
LQSRDSRGHAAVDHDSKIVVENDRDLLFVDFHHEMDKLSVNRDILPSAAFFEETHPVRHGDHPYAFRKPIEITWRRWGLRQGRQTLNCATTKLFESSLEMNWPYLTREEIAGILLLIVVLAGVFFAWVILPNSGLMTNWGFGPEWECSNPGKGGPVCVKRLAKPENSK